MVLAIIFLVVFGLAFGSFVNALVWRVHEQGKSKSKSANFQSSMEGLFVLTASMGLPGTI
jgi:prepilin signal peptidase PulO-like enzyme (type II secretory pathway)